MCVKLAVAMAATDLVVAQGCQEMAKILAALAALALAKDCHRHESMEQAAALGALALAEMTCHAVVVCAEVLAGLSLTNEHYCWESVEGTLAFAVKASANNEEVAIYTQDLTAANMAMTVFVVDTRCQEMAGAAQPWAVAKHSTVLVLLPSDNKASAPTMPPLAPPMAASSSSPLPYYICGRGPFYHGGEPSRNVSCSHIVALTFAYG
jgi:hypothetical protein